MDFGHLLVWAGIVSQTFVFFLFFFQRFSLICIRNQWKPVVFQWNAPETNENLWFAFIFNGNRWKPLVLITFTRVSLENHWFSWVSSNINENHWKNTKNQRKVGNSEVKMTADHSRSHSRSALFDRWASAKAESWWSPTKTC